MVYKTKSCYKVSAKQAVTKVMKSSTHIRKLNFLNQALPKSSSPQQNKQWLNQSHLRKLNFLNHSQPDLVAADADWCKLISFTCWFFKLISFKSCIIHKLFSLKKVVFNSWTIELKHVGLEFGNFRIYLKLLDGWCLIVWTTWIVNYLNCDLYIYFNRRFSCEFAWKFC